MRSRKLPIKKILVIMTAAVVIGGGIFIATNARRNNTSTETATETPAPRGEVGEGEINYSPPSEDEKQVSKDKKNAETPTGSPTSKTEAQVVITDASQYGNEIEVRAFASNVIENGTCKVVFTKGSVVIRKETPALADASTTQCRTLTVPRAEFPTAGTWSVTVEFISTEATGSKTQNMEVK